MMRQICKQILTNIDWRRLILAATASLCLNGPGLALTSTIVGTIVTDPLSGVANNGYDSVSYFTEDEPLAGRPEFEYFWSGVSWYFANAANRDVFIRDPETYAPTFGGYGLMGLARGFLSAGNPRIYVVIEGYLFLFYSTGNREAFMLSQRSSYQRAVKNWEFLSLELVKPQ